MPQTKKQKPRKQKSKIRLISKSPPKKKTKKQKLNPLQRERQELYLNQPNQLHNMGFRMLPSLIYRNKKTKIQKREKNWRIRCCYLASTERGNERLF